MATCWPISWSILACFSVIVIITIATSPLWMENHAKKNARITKPVTHMWRTRRSTINAQQKPKDKCLQNYGGTELDYIEGAETTFQFDLCSIISCNGQDSSWKDYDVYMCSPPWRVPTGKFWCGQWSAVWWYTGHWSPAKPKSQDTQEIVRNITLRRGRLTTTHGQKNNNANPLLLTLSHLKTGPFTGQRPVPVTHVTHG
ncbi:hypothetical protein XENOCAPTIV_011382 [Xenoophorus captivus]|uniref:Uncharacterized protein n=1 Tax=Xenoophorus captivus TaxID=1517983 RepID=A0ABV0R891_9TELE